MEHRIVLDLGKPVSAYMPEDPDDAPPAPEWVHALCGGCDRSFWVPIEDIDLQAIPLRAADGRRVGVCQRCLALVMGP